MAFKQLVLLSHTCSVGGIVRPGATENKSGTAGTRTQNQRIMSHRGYRISCEEYAVSAASAADGAANYLQVRPDDDLRLARLIDVWPGLSEETRDAICRLAGFDTDELSNSFAAPHGNGVLR